MEIQAAPLPALEERFLNEKAGKQKKTISYSAGRTNQVMTTTAIVLMFLIIMLSIAIRHWSNISPWLSQLLSGLNFP
jgi:hypothetical protein